MEWVEIDGTDKHLRKLEEELKQLGIPIYSPFPEEPYTHAVLFDNEVSFCIHDDYEDTKLNANLPSHRKHFISKSKEQLI